MSRTVLALLGTAAAVAAAGCRGMQSSLDPAGRDAERIAQLFTWMAAGTAIIWAVVVGLAVYAPRARERGPAATRTAIIGGGVLFPVVVLSALLLVGLSEMPTQMAAPPDGQLALDVVGSQWWWRVRYLRPGEAPIELANEIRLPVGRRVNVRVSTADVIHSFWIPPLAGKMDMIPGRVNRLALEPTRTGTFRGACAEYCGMSHARMNFIVVVMEPPAFEAWLANQARPAAPPADPVVRQGQAAFSQHGCITCHTVRGTEAAGVSGPDLTHVASRQTLAAGTLPATPAEFGRWITSTELLKPGVHMPAFAGLPDDTVSALTAYLTHLQ